MKNPVLIPFNVNSYIHVKMKKGGYEIMADIHNRYLGIIPKRRKRTYKYYEKKADKDGYTKFQLWCFIEDFGHYIFIGMNPIFDTEILFETVEP